MLNSLSPLGLFSSLLALLAGALLVAAGAYMVASQRLPRPAKFWGQGRKGKRLTSVRTYGWSNICSGGFCLATVGNVVVSHQQSNFGNLQTALSIALVPAPLLLAVAGVWLGRRAFLPPPGPPGAVTENKEKN